MRKSYPSDITKEQFEIIREDLEQATKKTHPRKYDLYDIFCAILYLLKEGCSWRAIPHDFPKWENVRYHYDIWAKEDYLAFLLTMLDILDRAAYLFEKEPPERRNLKAELELEEYKKILSD